MNQKNSSYEKVRATLKGLYRDSGVEREFNQLIELFSPPKIADYLGLQYEEVEEILSDVPGIETAGLLDVGHKKIYISLRFPKEQRRLTGMHELVHWMCHRRQLPENFHRDRVIDRQMEYGKVDYIEWEATHVACLTLMPQDLVYQRFAITFRQNFGEPLQFDEFISAYLRLSIEEVRKLDKGKRAFLLATTGYYGRAVVPLYQQFRVSRSAMAYRIKELELIAPDRRRGKPNLSIVR